MSDIHWYQKSVGLSPPKPDFGICQDRLHWKKLKEMKKEQRDAEVIKRANLYAFNWGYVGMKGVNGYELSVAISDATKAKNYSQIRKDMAAPQLDRLRLQFPLLDKGTGWEAPNNSVGVQGEIASARQEMNPNAAQLASEFQNVITNFKKTELCHQVKTMARKLFQSRQVNKIVAYGTGCLSCPTRVGNALTIRAQTQHAALLAIRDTWQEVHKAAKSSFNIYLSDPENWEIDEEAAAHFGMTVVNGGIGHQMGFLLIDEFTLVVDIISCLSVLPLVFEITRPAGLLTAWPIKEDTYESDVIFSYTLTLPNEKDGQKEEIIFPGHGVSERAVVAEGIKEYKEEKFDLSRCDMGQKPGHISAHESPLPTPQMGSTPAEPSKSTTVTSKAAHEPTPPTAPMGSTSAGPSKSKTVASKASHEPPPSTVQMESTPAGPSKSPSKFKTGMSKAKKVVKELPGKLPGNLSPSKSKRHSASQAGPSQGGPHTTSHSGPSHANPNPAPHTPSDPEVPTRTGWTPPPLPPDGRNGFSFISAAPTLYIRKW